MKSEKLLITSLVGVGISLSTASAMTPKWAKKGDTIVKCKGIAKKGKNDCGANGHACGGFSKKDNDPNEWIYVPEGVCEKITGGKILKTKVIK